MKNGKGYVLLARSVDKSEVASMPPCTRELWTYLLRRVNYADNGKLKRGQGFFSLEEIQTDLAWWVGYRREVYSKPDLTKAMRRLRESNMIETAKEVRGVIVTVCKYDHYQDPDNYEGNAKATRRKEHHATGVSTISEEGKKEKKEYAGESDLDFVTLWKSFEGCGARGKAWAYWQKLTAEDRAAILAKAPAYVKSTPGGKYRKNLEGWINPDERRWERPIVNRDDQPQGKKLLTKDEGYAMMRQIREANNIPATDPVPPHLMTRELIELFSR